jgi:hypothetical protein
MNTDWLAQLAPEHAPSPPGWWPPAPGWWILAALLIVLLIAGLVWWRHPRLRLRRAALAELRRIGGADLDLGSCARDIQSLLRRCALAVYGADLAAKLSGSAWLQFLASRGAAGINGASGRALLAASYGGPTPAPGAAGAAGDAPDPRAAWLREAENFVRFATARGARRARRSAPPARLAKGAAP